jgi:3-hydroxyisobutyrate dehydrogenase
MGESTPGYAGAMNIAFLGTGIMGAPMARNIAQAGHDVVVWNRTREKADAVEGVSVADSPADAVGSAEVVVTMLADGDAVEDVWERIAGAVREDAIWWQASTVGVDATDSLCEASTITYVDAPVLGTKQPAEDGKLTVLAAGPDDALDTLEPLFGAVAAKAIRLGDVGEATRAKLVLNHWILALTTATAETIGLARSLDVDPQLFLDIIDGAPMDSPYAQMKGRLMLADAVCDNVSFPLRLAHKDARLVAAAAPGARLAAFVEEVYARAGEDGLGDCDMAAIARLSAERAQRS